MINDKRFLIYHIAAKCSYHIS